MKYPKHIIGDVMYMAVADHEQALAVERERAEAWMKTVIGALSIKAYEARDDATHKAQMETETVMCELIKMEARAEAAEDECERLRGERERAGECGECLNYLRPAPDDCTCHGTGKAAPARAGGPEPGGSPKGGSEGQELEDESADSDQG